ncbi:adenine nucleotide alpha hydrolase [Chitinophaga barathri]|uniref:Adenine nucleotide alpha hydrolase n=1 Tax=Chitinophaga barathri TaxID=1647451 RepID=A0A3N4M8V9_9BACT|nr:adenine nucleotide alpha hydrolase [Chitinophaga barathri]RPD40094.1 adenine nucleotide alpha hydrolase [Chitinophaga barathri]
MDAYINWSGGKDAAFALWQLQQAPGYRVRHLFTTLSGPFRRVSMHGVREELLDEQARLTGLPVKKAYLPEHASMEDYNHIMHEALEGFHASGIRYAVFGDIFLEDLRAYRETQLAQAGMEGVFPLWKRDSATLVRDFIAAGFKAVIVCVNAKYLPASFAGRVIDETFLADLPPGVDPCGENGEFHSFVFDGPLFASPVPFTIGETVERVYSPAANQGGNCYKDDGDNDLKEEETGHWDTRFYFCDLLPA